MKVEYYREYSKILNRDMEYKVYGHTGKPCIAFPCQNGRFFDYENYGLIAVMAPYIEEGKIQIFCVDSLDNKSWSADYLDGRKRMEAQEAYFNYIIQELTERIYELNSVNREGVMTFGCSMGAYHAMNFFLRLPMVFDVVLAVSGIYHSGFFIKNYADELSYLNSPLDSLRHMPSDHPYLDIYRRNKIVVGVGSGAWEEDCLTDTKLLNEEFNRHNIPAWFKYFGSDMPHDWSSWFKQTPYFLDFILK